MCCTFILIAKTCREYWAISFMLKVRAQVLRYVTTNYNTLHSSTQGKWVYMPYDIFGNNNK